MTNADKIRAMTDDEELARFLYLAWFKAKWCKGGCSETDNCEPCWLKWLQQEAEE